MTAPPARTTPVRYEPRPCAVCGQEIVPGQLYVPAAEGPSHAFCRPPARLDVAGLAKAARQVVRG